MISNGPLQRDVDAAVLRLTGAKGRNWPLETIVETAEHWKARAERLEAFLRARCAPCEPETDRATCTPGHASVCDHDSECELLWRLAQEDKS